MKFISGDRFCLEFIIVEAGIGKGIIGVHGRLHLFDHFKLGVIVPACSRPGAESSQGDEDRQR